MNLRSTASSNGWVELEVTVIEGVEWGGEVSFLTALQQQAVFYLSFKRTLLDRLATGGLNVMLRSWARAISR